MCVNCAVVVARHSVHCARVVRHIRCLFSRSLAGASGHLGHETVCLDSRHGMHHSSRKSHVSILSRMVAELVFT